jgi:AcrR family transcriptional regulator
VSGVVHEDTRLVVRERLLSAASAVYGEHGWIGATTYRIAAAAGVHEVTLFRQFGSKQALLSASLRCALQDVVVPMPLNANDPFHALTTWCRKQMLSLRLVRHVVRRCALETESEDDFPARLAVAFFRGIAEQVLAYTDRLVAAGWLGDKREARVRAAMLTASICSDALWRDDMPTLFPDPLSTVPRRYAEAFLGNAARPRRARLGIVRIEG